MEEILQYQEHSFKCSQKKKKTEVYKQKAISRINAAHCREHLHEIPVMSSFEEASVI